MHRNRATRPTLITLLAASLLAPAVAPAADRPAERPYLGWSSWSLAATTRPGYGKSWLTAAHVLEQSEAMAARLGAHGYRRINVDAGWRGGWDEHGRPTPDPRRFPDGMQAVADRVHARGQEFGIYYVPGVDDDLLALNPPILGTEFHVRDIVRRPRRAAHGWGGGNAIDFGHPAAKAYIRSIADQFAAWGVDFLKFDGVTPGSDHRDLTIDGRDDVAAWDEALRRTGRPIWLTLSWDLDMRFADFWRGHADAIRITQDVESYDDMLTHWGQITRAFPAARAHAGSAGRGRGWNDLDSLLVGVGAMTDLTPDERRAAATLWAVAAAPIYSGDDLTKLDDLGVELLTNDEVLAVQQSGRVAAPVADDGAGGQSWAARDDRGAVTLALFNLGAAPRPVAATWTHLGLAGPADARDLWAHRDLGEVNNRFEVTLAPHACRLLRLTPRP